MDEVVIAKYNPRWPAKFAEEAEHLRQALGDICVGVEHVGSTAIPDLPAKPVLDILIGVTTLDAGIAAIPTLEALGYDYRGENGIPGRLFFRKGTVQYRRTHHLHLMETGHEQWAAMLVFREYLRGHPDEAQRYEALKHALAKKFRDNRSAYTNGKADFVQAVLAKANTLP